MKLRLLPPLWIVCVPLDSAGLFPQPAVPLATGPGVMLALALGPGVTCRVGEVDGVGVTAPPTRTSCHCWLVPPQSPYCTTLPPSAVEAPCTSTALPLFRLISRT